MFSKILIYLLKKAFDSKIRESIAPCITELHRRTVSDNLTIRKEIVRVKKGKRRYDILFIETPEGKLKFNLGRHWENNTIYTQDLKV